MARKIIDIGVVGNDGTGDSIRDSFRKVNDNFRELYSSLGLGDKLKFISMDDTPDSYVGQNDPSTGNTPLVTINNTESGLTFKQLKPGSGISIDFTTNTNEITINSDFAEIVADSSPQLGGNLSARSGGEQWRIRDLTIPVSADEAANKQYADTKISRAGVNAIDPATGQVNAAMGRMSGPLILSRDPEPDDDINFNGLIAASKRYVDNSAFGSVANLYVATSGQDDRPGVSPALQGRALAYAYRTLEAALKRAEELVLESRVEIGPYKKTLTYGGGEYECTLSSIGTSPISGAGFTADALMSVDTVTINVPGSNYNVGDILTLDGGTVAIGGQPATLEVLTTATTPGAVVTFKVVSSGVYTELPGVAGITTTVDGSSFGAGATFDVLYKVNNVQITDPGSGYSLVSVRITGGGAGSGAFGTAEVGGMNNGIIGITVTDQGSGFTSVPTVMADLPRFHIYTNGLRTDFTGDVESTSPQSFRSRDIREGLYIRGETSGALAQILAHSGELDGKDELFDVDIKYGNFEVGEVIAYGDVTKNIQITVLVESGIYEENYPLKVPQNTSIVGDEFRRVIFRPKPGTSSSPWAFQKFRRDLTNDGLVTAIGSEFGYHYLQDSSQPVYPKINNKGFYRAAASLLALNRVFIQEEVIAWINNQIETNTAPFNNGVGYDQVTCARDVGLIVDAVVSDLVFGTNYRTIKAGTAYLRSYASTVTSSQKNQTVYGIIKAKELVVAQMTDSAAIAAVIARFGTIIDILEHGINVVPPVVIPPTSMSATDIANANAVIIANKEFLKDEVIAYINDNLLPIPNYVPATCARDVGYIIDAIVYDMTYGGNSETVSSAKSYYNGTLNISPLEVAATIDAYTRLQLVIQDVVRNIAITPSASNTTTQDVSLPAGSVGTASTLANLLSIVIDVEDNNNSPAITLPTYSAGTTEYDTIRTTIMNDIVSIKADTISYLNSIATQGFSYNENLCKRDVGLIVDSLIFDLKWGSYNRTISAGLKYFQNASGRIAIGIQLSQTLAGIERINFLAQQIIDNTQITDLYQDLFAQTIDNAYISEANSDVVISDLITALTDVIDNSGSVNYPKENDQMDVFLANDAVRWQAITAQGHGGFMLTLDPQGQILAKSPYAQECASFAKSINAQTFAGGMFVDGFSGNLQFEILNKVSDTRLEVGNLDRIPNLPCSFIVLDTVYRVNYVRDFIYSPNGSTATLVLDETTPWPFDVFTYNSAVCERDVGLIIDGLGYDMVLGTNFNARKAGLTYREANAEVVILNQKNITVRAISYAHQLASNALAGYATQQTAVESSNTTLGDIVDRGPVYAPNLSLNSPTGLSSALANAKSLLTSNIPFIKDEVIGYLASAYPSLNYDPIRCARDVQYIIEALIYDLTYGGNSQTVDAGLKYFDGVGDAVVSQIPGGQLTETIAGIAWAKYVAKQVIVNAAPSTVYTSTPRVTGSASNAGTQATIETLMSNITNILGGGTAPAKVYPDLSAYAYDSDAKAARSILVATKASIQASVIDFVDTNANLYELLMPGNRSMLCNDFTQVNDLGYGIFATNSGLVEAVSMFTYYCHISYYSLKGAQIRSVGGSAAHGNYALVAEGSDPLEVPTPTGLFYDIAQGLLCYAPNAGYYNNAGDLFVYVTGYEYTPLGGSELEVDHSGVIYRYPVTSVVVEGMPTGVVRLNLTSDSTGNFDGLYAQIPDGVKMSLRLNSQVVLTGELVDVAVRPSTGLRLREAPENIYRVLQFDSYTDPNGNYPVRITQTSPGNFELIETIITVNSNVATTANNHNMKFGDKFIARASGNGFISGATYYITSVVSYTQFTCSLSPGGASPTLTNGTGLTISIARAHHFLENYYVGFTSTGTLPSPLVEGLRYYVTADGLTETSFRISQFKSGTPEDITSAGSGTHSLVTQGLTKTTLRENYNFVELVLYQPGEYVGSTVVCTITTGTTTVINKANHGLTAGTVIRFASTGSLPGNLSASMNYFVIAAGLTSGQFRISDVPGGTVLATSGSSTGTVTYGLVTGRVGDSSFAVVPVSPGDKARVNGMAFVFLGEEYVISSYESEEITNTTYARVNLNKPLVNSIINYPSSYTVKAAARSNTIEGTGSLTIRISLTRVTSHDLLEIGTGSYADTNYPSEIYGPAVNALNPTNETVERDVGRCFYVTTDQFGNFSVGPYFRVDQGTGRVTFSAAIALSNLDGIGFKRGVPIAEFSVDSGFSDNATDTVPTENATRIYIERRLGLTHAGQKVDPSQLIPAYVGGYMALDGTLAMKGDLDMDLTNKVINLADPVDPLDAVNLQSLTFTNLQEFTITDLAASDLLAFTGVGNTAINATVVGDLTFTINNGANTLNAQINPGVIIDADIKSDAAIVQSKLAMTAASTRSSASGIAQANLGLASFDSAQFTATNGWITLKDNGTVITKIEQIGSKTVLGNSGLATGDVSQVAFSSVVDLGLGIKKGQYSSGTGFLRRTSTSSFANDGDYSIVEMSATYTGVSDNSKLVVRDSSGNFAANVVDVSQLKIDTQLALDSGTVGPVLTPTGGFIKLYGYGSSGGVTISTGSVLADNVTYYDNTTHVFRSQNGLTNAPITASSIQVTAITTGGNTTAGTITGRWTLTGTSPTESRLQATYSADLAEYYEGDKDYPVGTVLVFGGEKEVTLTSKEGDTRVAGVVSNTAAFVMYDACPGLKNLVALQGRVPCRVVGKIQKGDMLITSRIPGVAVAAGADVKVGTVVGKALQNYDSDHVGTIEIAVGRT